MTPLDLTIAQNWRKPWDTPTQIHLGEFLPGLPPAAYYRRTGDFVLYCLFHWKDWSTWPWPFSLLDEHQFDLEGVLIGPEWSAAICHYEVKFVRRRATEIHVEHAGHGIHFEPRKGKPRIYRPGEYGLIEIDDREEQAWRRYFQPVLNAHRVSCPWQWPEGFWENPERLLERYG